MELLRANGLTISVLSGMMLDLDREVVPNDWLVEKGCVLGPPVEASGVDSSGLSVEVPSHLRAMHRGIPITFHLADTTRLHDAGDEERIEFLRLLDLTLSLHQFDVMICYGGNRLAREARSLARSRGIITVFPLHNFHYFDRSPFADADEVIVPSRFARDYYLDSLGLRCTILPNLITHDRVSTGRRDPRFVTFVNPTAEKGVYPFARIADELGRRRPDIPILVVESRGTEATVAGCGLELRAHGTVHFMAHTNDPRDFWCVSKLCLLPSVWWENQPLVAIEAMTNGIPVIGSDRGGIPETMGDAGIILPLPDRITQATRLLPTPEEVAPWVEAIIRFWDDPEFYERHRLKSLAEAKRWDEGVLGQQCVEFFRSLRSRTDRATSTSPGRAKAVVLVPQPGGTETECEDALRELGMEGVRVLRFGCDSPNGAAWCRLTSEALHDGFESIFFVDPDLGFDPLDALRLMARPEAVIAGVYAEKGRREFASIFADDIREVVFGRHAFGLYPLKYAATGFLRIKAATLQRMIEELELPRCDTRRGRGIWPFFQPIILPREGGKLRYLGGAWAFSHRLMQIGVTPMADTSIRLWRYGRYAYGWEDAKMEVERSGTFTHHFG